jgi:plasmid maintenance system killer protein
VFVPPQTQTFESRVRASALRLGKFAADNSDQWRVCFRWQAGDAYEVEIVDYH